jgi:hypothetical protein
MGGRVKEKKNGWKVELSTKKKKKMRKRNLRHIEVEI